MLATRLMELTEAGSIKRSSEPDDRPYELTELGLRTDRVLWELSRFGANFEPEPDVRGPGNLRMMTIPLSIMLESVTDRPTMVTRLLIDDDAPTVTTSPTAVQVTHGETTDQQPDLVIRSDDEAFLDAGEGRWQLDRFAADHVDVVAGAPQSAAFLAMMAKALEPLLAEVEPQDRDG